MTPAEAALRRALEHVETDAEVYPRRRRSDWDENDRSRERFDERGRQTLLLTASATLEAHNRATAQHSDDVVALSEAIADRLGLEEAERARVLAAAQLHDIGKVSLPSAVLEKTGPLDEDEWRLVREHTVAGERILQSLPDMIEVARIVRSSHERWDGDGYPDGLKGEQIPLGSRIVFCADAFHAIRSDRPYRPGRPAPEALAEVEANAGSQFDPAVVEALVEVARDLRQMPAPKRRALSTSFRSRRVAALLLALTISGSALAAGLGPLPSLFGGDEEAVASSGCVPGAPCLPAELGRFGLMPRSAPGAKDDRARAARRRAEARRRAAARREAAVAPRRGVADPPSGRGEVRGERVDSPGSSAGPAPGGNSLPGASDRSTGGDPVSLQGGGPSAPGRSEEAPGKPEVLGKPPKVGAPGRSEEAPRRPDSPPGHEN